METKRMKKEWMVLGVIFVMLFFFSTEAFSWQFATHAYIADHIGSERRLDNNNEIYGAIVPDVFNYLFDDPQALNFWAYETHANFLKVWDSARGRLQPPLAYGFVSHGIADLRTHDQACGYAIIKAAEILSRPLPPELAGPIEELKLHVPDERILIEMFHVVVENAVDILLKRNDDPFIGQKVASAAILRSHQLPLLLEKAYASDFASTFRISPLEAFKFIHFGEKEFRKSIIFYGQILMQDERTAIRLISEQTADAAVSYLGLYGIDLAGLFENEEEIIDLIVGLTNVAISICENDYEDEIEATIDFVNHQLKVNGITY